MSHVREASGCHTPEPKRVKFSGVPEDSDGSEGVDDVESMNGSAVMSEAQIVNYAQSVNGAQGMIESEVMNDAQGVNEIQDVNEAQNVNGAQGMIESGVMEGVQAVNEAQSVNGSDDELNMFDLDAALLPLENAPSLDDFEPLGHVETGWEFIQYSLQQQQQQQQQVVQEEIVPDQANNVNPAGNIYSGPLFAPRPVPKWSVNKYPEFAALIVSNHLVVPGLTERQSRFLVTYLMNNTFWALPNEYESMIKNDEEDFEDAIKLHGVGHQYHLPGLVNMAHQTIINMLRGQVSLQFAINAFKRDRVWYRSNTELIRESVSHRARQLGVYALYMDVQDYTDGHGTSSPIINGLLEALIVLKGQLPGVGDEAEPYGVIDSLLH
ncbi:hypothetical protein ACHAP5_009289 [Fusarium lateritium]